MHIERYSGWNVREGVTSVMLLALRKARTSPAWLYCMSTLITDYNECDGVRKEEKKERIIGACVGR
jgi:hypothetical protein